jgi:hypothetical protein
MWVLAYAGVGLGLNILGLAYTVCVGYANGRAGPGETSGEAAPGPKKLGAPLKYIRYTGQ